ncbi:hypothetical protein G2912_26220 [Paraburkholderia aspalathi]|uniref:Uncharacterized protein n=1 Tax=Paraburkholderia nemoris TaxID=2793076 RepID=A0ABM8SDH0_9BURK|nr:MULTISPECIES: hypothetical protein [Paraburkholderia]MBK3813861.1 hypothetical protein [Paraburkholderia aspalathi]CAE6802949.1 hypothetical protein R69776_05300 [Paraburkholderia nemoris]
MTCEVAVLNRLAVALAADSAATFTSFAGGAHQRTYATGANKIFQLTKAAPVGVMLYNTAALQEVPWELVIKSFRDEMGGVRRDSLVDYASALADYIRAHEALFPAAHREKHFKQLAAGAFLRLLDKAITTHPILAQAGPAAALDAEMRLFVDEESHLNAGTALARHFTDADVARAKTDQSAWLAQEIAEYLQGDGQHSHLSPVLDTEVFAELVIESLYRFYWWHFNDQHSGIVVAGYGDRDYLPAYVEIRYYGFLLNRLVADEKSHVTIDHNRDAVIEAFAKKSMVETFMSGVGPEVFSTVSELFRVHASNLLTGLNVAGAPDAQEQLELAQNAFTQAWTRRTWDSHYAPLNSVISGLPPSEMAELAETLVTLESLKEKVTQRTQSVGGPVDVAVITRAEGLVWIKRKHYFRADLNPRYFARQSN